MTGKSVRAIQNVRRICEEHLAGQVRAGSRRPLQEPAARARRPDHRRADADQAAAAAAAPPDRRHVGRSASPRRARHPAEAPARDELMTKRKNRRRRASRTIQRLRRRLREAEDTLKAIRDGHVDALVVSSPDGEQLYTLRTADQPYRLMVEQMREGRADAERRRHDPVLQRAVRRAGGDRRRAHHRPELRRLHRRRRISRSCRRCSTAEMLSRRLSAAERRRRTSIPAQLSSIALRIDGVRTVAVVVSDLTPRTHRARAARIEPAQGRVPGDAVARAAHAAERDPRLDAHAAGRPPRPSRRGSTRSQLIDRNAQAQAQLVNDLVDMSRMTTGKLTLRAGAAAGGAGARGGDRKHPAGGRGQEPHARDDLARRRSPACIADATRLQQVLWNLLSNAVKFTPEGGTDLGQRRRRSTAASGSRSRDTGIGIDPAFVPHVFDRFRQADSGTTRAQGGLGLGLAIVRDLVRLHGGEVEVQSAGSGPRARPSRSRCAARLKRPANADRVSRKTASLAGHCVVVVEDHDDSRELMRMTLENAGAAVAAFQTARERRWPPSRS